MNKKTSTTTKRVRHAPQYRAEALALAERIGVKAAAGQLGIHDSQIYGWRQKALTYLWTDEGWFYKASLLSAPDERKAPDQCALRGEHG